MFGFKKRRRERLENKPFPEKWIKILDENVMYYRYLPEAKRKQLHGHIHVFLNEKKFEGCGGLEINDEIRITIAGQACIMILGGISDYFPSLVSILIYPQTYYAPFKDHEEGGIITTGREWRQGEAWDRGSMVLSWQNVKLGTKYADGKNLVLHEFAHLLDHELGATETWHSASGNSTYAEWSKTLNKEHKHLIQRLERNEPVLFDPYGAESLVEFFAVATESFFEKPGDMKKLHPNLYHQLEIFYTQDPASIMMAKK